MNQKDDDLAALLLKQPDSLEDLIEQITPAIYEVLRTAVELGKWDDGSRLAPEQVEFCMQALILYDATHLPEGQRIGARLNDQCASRQGAETAQVLNIVDSGDS